MSVLFGYSTDTFLVIEEDLVHSGDHSGAFWLLQRHFAVTGEDLVYTETMSVLFGYSTDTFAVIEEDLLHSGDNFDALWLLHRHFAVTREDLVYSRDHVCALRLLHRQFRSHRRGFGPQIGRAHV